MLHNNLNAAQFRRGLRDGVPIGLGYFAVAFTLGIAAKNAGFTAGQATLTSFLINASAGEFAGFTLIAAGASYLEVAVMELIANARYLLMSCSLSQKLPSETPLRHRLLVAFDLTDEIFAISVVRPGALNPWYTYGAVTVALPGWSLGTCLGVVMGNVLPARLVCALSVGLYGMFLAIIVPPARQSRIVAGVVLASMAASFAVSRIHWFDGISSGMKIILLTLVIAGAAAVLFPVQEGAAGAQPGQEGGAAQ